MKKFTIVLIILPQFYFLFSENLGLNYAEFMKTATLKDIRRELAVNPKCIKTKIGYRKENLLLCAIRNNKDSKILSALLQVNKYTDKNIKKQDALTYTCIYTVKDEAAASLILNQYGSDKKLTKALKKKDKAGKSSLNYIKANENCIVYRLLQKRVKPSLLKHYKPKTYDAFLEKERQEKERLNAPPPPTPPSPPPLVVEETAPNTPLSLSNIEEVDPYRKMFLFDYLPKDSPKPSEEEIGKVIASPNKADLQGRTLLMLAAKSGNNWEVQTLLNSGASVNLTDLDGWSALMYAVRYQDNIEVVDTLISHGAAVDVVNRYGIDLLTITVTYSNNPLIIRKIIENLNPSSTKLFDLFITILTQNASNPVTQESKLKIFIDMNVPINRFYNGKTPLMYAAIYAQSTSILRLFLDNGAIKSMKDPKGMTAYDYAQLNRYLAHDNTYWALNTD